MSSLPTIPGYQIERKLGAGGMGVVYAASRADTGFKYAVKMLLVGRTASFPELARFRIEAEAYACLNHPCVIKIRDVGVVCGCPYLAMDFAENGSLDLYLNSNPKLGVEWRVQTIKRVADGLSHAHGRSILHRDLKPGNILIMADGSPKLTDFGLVKFTAPVADVSRLACTMVVSELDPDLVRATYDDETPITDEEHFNHDALVETLSYECARRTGLSADSFHLNEVRRFLRRTAETRRSSSALAGLELDNLTQVGSVLGSPQFMAPEQATGQLDRIGPQTDVYGLGATLYKVLTDQPPIPGSSLREVIRNVSTETPVPPNFVNNCVSEDLGLVVMKALEKSLDRRYASIEMFAEDLDRVLYGRPTVARLQARTFSKASRTLTKIRATKSRAATGSFAALLFRSKKSTKDQAT